MVVGVDVKSRLYRYLSPSIALRILVEGLGRREYLIDVRRALNKVLAEDVYSPIDRPWINLSHVDGFAVYSKDTLGATSTRPIKLRVVEGVNSRNAHEYSLKNGETVFVETGYPVPEGADAVIPVEAVKVVDNYVLVYSSVKPGFNITPKAGDVGKGELIARRGTIITPAIQKLMMDLGIRNIRVYDNPRVVVIGVGDELVDEIVPPTTSKIPNSSTYMVKGILEYHGANIVDTMILPDDPERIVNEVRGLVNNVDVVVTIGGVSMGPKDYTWKSLKEKLGAAKYFRGLRIQPGRATSGLRIGNSVVINMPGLPQSTLASLVFILLPLINYLRGIGLYIKLPYTIAVNKRKVEVKKYPSFHRIRYVTLQDKYAEVVAETDSYYISPIALTDGFTIIPPGKTIIDKNEEIKVYHLPPVHEVPYSDILP